MKNLQELTKKFEERKKVTSKAKDDLYAIFEKIDKMVDDITICTSKEISCRASWISDGEITTKNGKVRIKVKGGKTSLYFDGHYVDTVIDKEDIDYISISDVVEGIHELFEEFNKVSTREDEGKKISSILEMLNK